MSTGTRATTINLTERGQRVMIRPEHARVNGVPEGEPFEIAEVTVLRGDAFVRLRDRNGRILPRWHRATELVPSRRDLDPSVAPRVAEREKELEMMSAEQKLITLSNQIMKTEGLSLPDATKAASLRLETEAHVWREQIRSSPEQPAHEPVQSLHESSGQAAFTALCQRTARERGLSPKEAVELVLRERFTAQRQPGATAPVLSLHARPDEGFVELVGRVQRERQLDLRSAMRICAESFPELAATYERGETL